MPDPTPASGQQHRQRAAFFAEAATTAATFEQATAAIVACNEAIRDAEVAEQHEALA